MVSPLDHALADAAADVVAAGQALHHAQSQVAIAEQAHARAIAWFHALNDEMGRDRLIDPAAIAQDLEWAGLIVAAMFGPAGLPAGPVPLIRVAGDLAHYITREAPGCLPLPTADWTTRATDAADPAIRSLLQLVRPGP